MKRNIFLLLTIILHAWSLCAQDDSGNAGSDTIQAKELKEVIVTADANIQKGGYEVLILSKENRNFGVNALDAVSSLNRFVTSLNGNTLTSWDREEVYVLIDGIPSTAIDLKTFSANDVKNVEYYPVTPPQYMGLTSGPVANIILKKRHDRLYSGYFDASNAVTTGFGTNQANLSYRDSLNQVRLDYYFDYRDIGSIKKFSEYNHQPSTTSLFDEAKKYNGSFHRVSGSYQRFQGKYLFNAKLTYLYNPVEETSFGDALTTDGSTTTSFPNNYLLKTQTKSISLDLYYNYVFKNNSIFAINMVNTLGKSYSESALWSTEISPENANERVYSHSDNDTYSFITNAYYASRVLGGRYSFGSRYEYKQLEQHYANGAYKPYSHDEFASASISWLKNGMTLYPAIGLNIMKQADNINSYTSVLPYMRLYTDWWAKGSLKGLSLQLTMSKVNKAPSLSLLTGSPTYIDYNFYSTGNPNLKNYVCTRLNLPRYISRKRTKIRYALWSDRNMLITR